MLKKLTKFFLIWKNIIVNSFGDDLSSGIVEGTNNVMKQVKHNACGYSKFSHLKVRIILIKGVYKN